MRHTKSLRPRSELAEKNLPRCYFPLPEKKIVIVYAYFSSQNHRVKWLVFCQKKRIFVYKKIELLFLTTQTEHWVII